MFYCSNFFCYLGLLEVVKELIEFGNLHMHSVSKVIAQLKKLTPKSKKTGQDKVRDCRAQQDRWNDISQFLQCYESKKDVEKCRP